jgi:8-oxo-dGTP diphosphatase
MAIVPQFGQPKPGVAYPDRPGAFCVVRRDDGQIALARIDSEGRPPRWDLPGGGVDEGETPAQAAQRECGEEVGLVVSVELPFVAADQYYENVEGVTHNIRGLFFMARLEREDANLKVEDDHNLVWTDPFEALRILDRDAHAWALAAWLRVGADR